MAKQKTKYIFKRKSKVCYTTIPNHILNDVRLSWGEKGQLVYLLSKPDDWMVYANELNKHSRDGRRLTNRYLKKLEEFGYISKSKKRNKQGRFDGWEYFVYAIPYKNQSLVVVHRPTSEKRSVGEPERQLEKYIEGCVERGKTLPKARKAGRA
jgi:hypothetical protein